MPVAGCQPVLEPTAAAPAGSLEIRPPRQQRSREAWRRILDAGVALLEEGGYQAFTIAAVCERAQVPPRAVYARVATKDALFLAVYEHGMARIRSDQDVLEPGGRWDGRAAGDLVTGAVAEVAGIFARHAAFLRSVVLVSGVHPEIYRRGARYSRELGDQFAALLLQPGLDIDQPDPPAAVRAAFNAVFSTLVLRTAYGPAYASFAGNDDEDFLRTLTAMVRRYLLRP